MQAEVSMMTADEAPTAYRETVFYRISRLRMPFSYAMALMAIILAPQRLFPLALVPIVIGALIRIWAAGHVVKRRKLSMGGPYAYTRNPLYLGSLISGVGTVLLIQNWWLLIAFLVGFVLFYGSAARSEEDYLLERHGEQFLLYKKQVPAFVPRLIPAPSIGESAFTWHDVVRNDEHKAVFWSALVVAAIFVRAYLA